LGIDGTGSIVLSISGSKINLRASFSIFHIGVYPVDLGRDEPHSVILKKHSCHIQSFIQTPNVISVQFSLSVI
jgi:hypothetical protein